mmetsp:Transcript_26531/g.82964  ORF Transcript_26531/g.82964 Transcript_26531/m.82964 type:complete len:332 (-) Transcript_26531:770-1765(-)
MRGQRRRHQYVAHVLAVLLHEPEARGGDGPRAGLVGTGRRGGGAGREAGGILRGREQRQEHLGLVERESVGQESLGEHVPRRGARAGVLAEHAREALHERIRHEACADAEQARLQARAGDRLRRRRRLRRGVQLGEEACEPVRQGPCVDAGMRRGVLQVRQVPRLALDADASRAQHAVEVHVAAPAADGVVPRRRAADLQDGIARREQAGKREPHDDRRGSRTVDDSPRATASSAAGGGGGGAIFRVQSAHAAEARLQRLERLVQGVVAPGLIGARRAGAADAQRPPQEALVSRAGAPLDGEVSRVLRGAAVAEVRGGGAAAVSRAGLRAI